IKPTAEHDSHVVRIDGQSHLTTGRRPAAVVGHDGGDLRTTLALPSNMIDSHFVTTREEVGSGGVRRMVLVKFFVSLLADVQFVSEDERGSLEPIPVGHCLVMLGCVVVGAML